MCYKEWCLGYDIDQIGLLFEKCESIFFGLYHKHLNIVKFLTDFMSSRCREKMERGNTELLSVDVSELMERYINIDCNGDYQKYISNKNEESGYVVDQLRWVGWYYVHLHWYLKVSSRDILKVQSVEQAVEQYYCGHQMGFDGICERVMWMFRRASIEIDESELDDSEFLMLNHMTKTGERVEV